MDPDLDEVGLQQLKTRLCQRLQFLARELLDAFSEPDRIFVYRLTFRRVSDEELLRIVRAIRRLGEGWLLYVTLAEAGKPSGTVEVVRDGLMVGYIDHFVEGPNGERQTVDRESWLTICRNALTIWRETIARTKQSGPDGGGKQAMRNTEQLVLL